VRAFPRCRCPSRGKLSKSRARPSARARARAQRASLMPCLSRAMTTIGLVQGDSPGMTITAGRAAPRNESRYSAICDRARLCASSINFLPPCVVNPIDASLPTRGNRATRLSLFPLSRRTKRQLRESARSARMRPM